MSASFHLYKVRCNSTASHNPPPPLAHPPSTLQRDLSPFRDLGRVRVNSPWAGGDVGGSGVAQRSGGDPSANSLSKNGFTGPGGLSSHNTSGGGAGGSGRSGSASSKTRRKGGLGTRAKGMREADDGSGSDGDGTHRRCVQRCACVRARACVCVVFNRRISCLIQTSGRDMRCPGKHALHQIHSSGGCVTVQDTQGGYIYIYIHTQDIYA